MYKYVYKNPLKNGYKQFKLSKKQHNEIFKHGKLRWIDRCEYYYNDNDILIHKFASLFAKILVTVMFPINILMYGLKNFKEIITEYKEMYNEKKYGSFVSDSIPSNADTYKKVIDIINGEESAKLRK